MIYYLHLQLEIPPIITTIIVGNFPGMKHTCERSAQLQLLNSLDENSIRLLLASRQE